MGNTFDSPAGFATTGQATGREGLLLRTLYSETVEGFHREEPDTRSFEEIGQRAGLGTVGAPDTRTSIIAVSFRNLETGGYVSRVKDPDGPLRYRISRIGERHVMHELAEERNAVLQTQVADLAASLAQTRASLKAEETAHRITASRAGDVEEEMALMQAELDRARMPWWRRVFAKGRDDG